MTKKRLFLALGLIALAASCQPQPVTQPVVKPSPAPSALASPRPGAGTVGSESLSAFVLQIRERFTIQGDFTTQAVSEQHQALIEKAVTEFLADMESGSVDDYFEIPDFAVKLLAGSEGSYFTGADALASLTSKAASYAMALVVDSEGYSAIFKGQFANDSFFFDGADSLPPENTAYLITLDGKLEATVTSGSLTPFTIQAVASPSASPSASPASLPTPSPLDLGEATATPPPPPERRFEDALAAQRRRGPEYGLVAGRFRPGPPPPPPQQRPDYFVPPDNPAIWPSPEVWERVKRERPEVAEAYRALRGLLPAEHRRRLTELYEANQDIFPVPPPEGPVKPPEDGPERPENAPNDGSRPPREEDPR